MKMIRTGSWCGRDLEAVGPSEASAVGCLAAWSLFGALALVGCNGPSGSGGPASASSAAVSVQAPPSSAADVASTARSGLAGVGDAVSGPAAAAAAQPAQSLDATASGAAADPASRPAPPTIADRVADAAITAGINTSLAADKELSALKINVDTHDGNVTLRGTAPNEEARDRASALAKATRGVEQVDNQLQVKP